jgi:hypothetical protein
MKRVKRMPKGQFEQVLRLNWQPVELAGDALPDFARAVPGAVRHRILASGEANAKTPYASELVPSGYLIGGMDVYRHAPDDPVALNKDWYAVVERPADSCILLVDGPFRDDEHWLDSIPERYERVQVLGLPTKRMP